MKSQFNDLTAINITYYFLRAPMATNRSMTVYLRDPLSEPVFIAFAGDIAPGIPEHGRIDKSDELMDLMRTCSVVVANLECPVTNAESVKLRMSSLRSDPSTVRELKDLNMTLVSLANNHIMDRGLKGLEDTLSTLDKASIARIGAGHDIDEASRPYLWHGPGVKVAFLAFSYECPYAPSTAGPSTPGANPLLMSETAKTIASLKRQGYLVCISYHGGEEFFRVPCPKRRVLFQSFARCGADIVIGHHAHVFQGIETLDGSLLAYSLGNFLMTTPYQIAHKGTDIGLLLIVGIDGRGPFALSTHFVRNQRSAQAFALIHGKDEENLRNLLRHLSLVLGDKRLLTREWHRDCVRMLLRLNQVGKIPPLQRLFRAVKISRKAIKRAPTAKPLFYYGDGWRYECSDQEVIRDGLRGIPTMLARPKKITACYSAYDQLK